MSTFSCASFASHSGASLGLLFSARALFVFQACLACGCSVGVLGALYLLGLIDCFVAINMHAGLRIAEQPYLHTTTLMHEVYDGGFTVLHCPSSTPRGVHTGAVGAAMVALKASLTSCSTLLAFTLQPDFFASSCRLPRNTRCRSVGAHSCVSSLHRGPSR